MNIPLPKFLKKYLTSEAPTVTQDQLKTALGNKLQAELLTKVGIVESDLKKMVEDQTLVLLERCLRGDTKISLLDGTNPTIKEMAENREKYVNKSVLSINPKTQELEPDRIIEIKKTLENTQLIRVWLDNNQFVDCTPEHRFMLRNGEYKEAKDLLIGESLMPLYIKSSETHPIKGMRGYVAVYKPKTNSWSYIHRLVMKFFVGKLERRYVIHHKDYNKLNNDPFNLELMKKEKHAELHHKNRVVTEVTKKKISLEMFKRWGNPEYRKRLLPHLKELQEKNRVSRIVVECVNCKKKIEVTPYKIIKNKEHYCKECSSDKGEALVCSHCGHIYKCRNSLRDHLRHTSLTKEEKTKILPPIIGLPFISKICLNCKMNFNTKRKMQVFCSQKCMTENTIKRKTRICPNCGKIYVGYKTCKKYCSFECGNQFYKKEHQLVLNHKVLKIEWLQEKADTYDIQTEKNHNFPLTIGIFVHNSSIYQTIDRALVHPLMSAACGLMAEYATVMSPQHDATVWVTAENKEYKYQIEKLLDIINMEEVIYDWTWTGTTFGDLFVRIFGEPGVGIVSVNDDDHPVNISRLDYNGRLCGFFETPMGYNVTTDRPLLTPWDFVHFRLLGARRRRPIVGSGDSQYTEFRTINIMTPDPRRLTSKYGNPYPADALPTWKRLRLAEDSILMARITRGIIRYIWKVVIENNNTNTEAISQMVDSYVNVLKRARALSVDPTAPNYQDRFSAPAGMEDFILPVWGNSENLKFDKIGGEVDIKWIVDVEELQRQLATALKTPLPLLAGYSDKSGGIMGQDSLARVDIRFARQARRSQRMMISGLTRMAQIHLAYQGINPDLRMFQIHMSETSTAEEKEKIEALEKGASTANQLFDFWEKGLGVDLDKKALLNYINNDLLKLKDIDPEDFVLKGNANALRPGEGPTITGPGAVTKPEQNVKAQPGEGTPEANPFKESIFINGSDLKSALPKPKIIDKIDESTKKKVKTTIVINEDWAKNWGNKKVHIKGK